MNLPPKVADFHIEREESKVLVRLEYEDGVENEDVKLYLPPTQAMAVASWMQQAAADAKRYEDGENE
jgi:hypothetical protein